MYLSITDNFYIIKMMQITKYMVNEHKKIIVAKEVDLDNEK